MKKFHVTVNGKTYDVAVEEVGVSSAPVMPAAPVAAAAPAPAAPAVPAATPAAAPAPVAVPADGVKILSPMPGAILDVKVSAGTAVKQGDILVLLEAMKMENEIRAPQDGTVAAVSVAKGDQVSTDDLLIVLQ